MKTLLHSLYLSSTWIATAGALACCLAFTEYEKLDFRTVLLAFIGIWLRYNVTVFGAKPSPNERIHWLWVHKKEIKFIFFMLLPIAIWCAWPLHFMQHCVLAIAGLLAAAYIWPLFGIPLRKVPYAKTVLIALTWTLVTYMLPSFPWQDTIWIGSLERFFICICICLAFDIQDAPEDRRQALRTIPLAILHTARMCLCFLLLIMLCAALCYWAYPQLFLWMLPIYVLLLGLSCLPLLQPYLYKIGDLPPYSRAQLMLLDGIVGMQGLVALLL